MTTAEPQEPAARSRRAHTLSRTARTRLQRARFRSRRLRRPVVALRRLGLRPDDAFVASYPRSGSTWTLFMLCDLLDRPASSFDELTRITPYVARPAGAPGLLARDGRLLHSHEAALGSQRAVYLVRDPRSVVLSEYRFQLTFGFYSGPFAAFLDDFLRGRSNAFGSWSDHVVMWLRHRHRHPDRLLVVRYEDLRQAPAEHLERIAVFLGVTAPPWRVDRAVAANDLAAMRDKERRSARPKRRSDLDVVGQGGVTLWQDALTPRQAAAIAERFGPAMRAAGYEA